LIKAWVPTVISASREGDTGRANRGAVLFLLIATVLYLASLPACRLVAHLIDAQGKFATTYQSIPVVVLGGWLLAFYHVFGIGFFVQKKPAAILPITFVSAVSNIAFTFLLIWSIGLTGAPYALVLGNAVFTGLSIFLGYRMFRYESPAVARIGVACLGVGLAAFAVDRLLSA
jgi:Na+-driven multidrug efflux pump